MPEKSKIEIFARGDSLKFDFFHILCQKSLTKMQIFEFLQKFWNSFFQDLVLLLVQWSSITTTMVGQFAAAISHSLYQ
jgi:serine acetyltransferase